MALLTAALADLPAPAEAQIAATTPESEPERLLFPSWSRQISELGLGIRPQLSDSASLFRPSGRDCRVGSTLGYAAGAVADALWPDALVGLFDLSPRALFHVAPELSSLDRLGAAVGQALVCPSPLVRTGWHAAGSRPTAPPG